MTPEQIDEKIRELASEGLSNGKIGEVVGKHREWVRRRRSDLGIAPSRATAVDTMRLDGALPEASDTPATEFSLTPDGGEFKNFTSREPLTDFSDVFRKFNRDPDEFIIVDDTVTQRAWEQSAFDKRTGTRNTVTLYSYSAKFRRKTEMDELDLPALYQSARFAPKPDNGATDERVTVLVWSDPQIGKTGSRGGTKELIDRSVEKRAALAAELERRRPKRTVLLDGGDGIEGFESGGNPMFTNDLSLAKQLDLYGTELMEWAKVLLRHGHVDIAAVPSNHAAWRNGRQNLGNPGDDLGLFMHKQVQKVAEAAGLDLSFHRPPEHDESIAIDVDGTVVGLVHGNQFGPGQAVSWWEKQTFGAQAVASADVMVTAHYHSFGASVAGRNPHSGRQRWWLGAPTLDNGSDWFRNSAGRDSDPGVLIFDITPNGFDLASLAFL